MSHSKLKHVLTGLEFSANELSEILHLAQKIKKNPEHFRHSLNDKNLAMIFEKPSFRTRLSFMRAMQSLGGTAIESVNSTRKSEEPRDLMRVLNGYCDMVMIRTHNDSILNEMAEHANIPIINGLSALRHPCQIFADLLTLQESFSVLENRTLAYIGDGNNILHSLLELAPQMGVSINYCCPESYQPDPEIASACMKQFGDRIARHLTPQSAANGVDAVYTDVWTSMGYEAENRAQHFENFQVNESLMKHAKSNAIFMHCMPMERGKEVSSTLPDSQASKIFVQSENRLHVQKAVMLKLVSG